MLDLLMNRRTIRKYKDQEVDKDTIDKVLTGALTSPSGRNKKPWELVVVTDKDVLAQLSKARSSGSNQIKEAGFAIVVLADPELTDVWVEDASIMATVIQLTAQSLGLGSCWVQIRKRLNKEGVDSGDYIKELLNIPEKYRVECMLAIGYPDEEKEAHKKEDLSFSKVHYNNFNK